MIKLRILLTIAYEGTLYAGWQLQGVSQRQPTIQGTIENALQTLTGRAVRIHCAGRTDAGVHALAQKAHFDANHMRASWDWRKRLNALLPQDIRIVAAEPVPDDFHARKNAISKTYIYQFWQEPAFTPPHLRNWVWSCGPLDPEKIRHILPAFTGEHDFASFQNTGTPVKTTSRNITAIRLEEISHEIWLPPYRPLLRLTITGNGFLKQMVRNIAGYLQALGAGKKPLPAPEEIFAARSRAFLSTPTAPAKGLCMAGIDYAPTP